MSNWLFALNLLLMWLSGYFAGRSHQCYISAKRLSEFQADLNRIDREHKRELREMYLDFDAAIESTKEQ